MSMLDLVREDLRDFGGYSSARSAKLQGDIWLNANESAWANPGDAAASCRRSDLFDLSDVRCLRQIRRA